MTVDRTKLRITLCSRTFSMQGGAERFFFNLTQFLKDRGHSVKVITLKAVASDGVAVVEIPKPASTRACRDWAYGRSLAQAVARDDCDVSFGEQKTWHCNVIRPGGGVEDEYWKTHLKYEFPQLRIPNQFRTLYLKRTFDLLAERHGYFSSHFRQVVANSEMVRQQLIRHYPHLAERITVVYNGVDLKRFDPQNRHKWRQNVIHELAMHEEGIIATFVGYDYKRKGLRQAIETIAKLRDAHPPHPVQLLVVGGHYITPYERLAEHLGVSQLIRFVGSTTRPEEYYAASDVLLLPSFYDACANVVLEALASGLPVLTTRENGGSDLLTHGLNGWVVEDPADIETMATYLMELQHPDRRASLAEEAATLARKHPMESKLEAAAIVLENVAEENRRLKEQACRN